MLIFFHMPEEGSEIPLSLQEAMSAGEPEERTPPH